MTTRPQKITFGEVRKMGIPELPIGCTDYGVHHPANEHAYRWRWYAISEPLNFGRGSYGLLLWQPRPR